MRKPMGGNRLVIAAFAAALHAPAALAGPPASGCYERVYDAAHLAAHPTQKVVAMRLLLSGQRTGGEGRGVLPASLFVQLRGVKSPATEGYALHGYCDDSQPVLRCRPEWNAGTWRIESADDGVIVRNGNVTLNPANYDAEEVAPGAVRVPAKPDDSSWKLQRTSAENCRRP